MLSEQVFDKLLKDCPEAVMMRAALEHALPPELVDEVFEEHRQRQYSRDLLFSTVVQLTSLVVGRIYPSIHAAYQDCSDQTNVSGRAFYDKLNNTEPQISVALADTAAERMADVVRQMQAEEAPLIPGYRTRLVDGNHFAATEHRLQELRTIGGGPLPGLAIVVYDAELRLARKIYLAEDAYTQERELILQFIDDIERGALYIADRNFCTSTFVWEIAVSGGFFIVRKHQQNVRVRSTGQERYVGRSDTGDVFEEPIVIEDDFGNEMVARRVYLRLQTKTRDGDREIVLLTNLPDDVSALQVAAAYRRRWTIETAFADLDRLFEGEIRGLGHPRAALLVFSLALVAYNALSVMRAALRTRVGAKKERDTISSYYLSLSVIRNWSTVEFFARDETWSQRYAGLTPQQLAAHLVELAGHIKLSRHRKHPRGPKKPPPKRTSAAKRPHVSTARILAERRT